MPQSLAFIGTGIMGLPMAGHLLAAGHRLTLHSRTRAKAEPLLAKGATWADSPEEAARNAHALFIGAPAPPAVRNALRGDHGVITPARPNLIVVDHSTISPS